MQWQEKMCPLKLDPLHSLLSVGKKKRNLKQLYWRQREIMEIYLNNDYSSRKNMGNVEVR